MTEFSLNLFHDITPTIQNDGLNPLCAIDYPEEYSNIMNIFRSIVNINEKSERVLLLTEELLSMNAANYTVWQYRRDILRFRIMRSMTICSLDC